MAQNIPDNKVWCQNVTIKKSTFSNPQTGEFDGAFAAVAIKSGDLVEKGLMRRLPPDFDGNICQFVFTWSDVVPNKTWAIGSGTSAYYNTDKPESANTRMVRFFEEDRFEIYATRDIKEGEELMHTYKSLKTRDCFRELGNVVLGEARMKE